jgi:hypothetical protein
MGLKEMGREGTQWIHLAQDMAQWHAQVKALMNSRLHEMREIFV